MTIEGSSGKEINDLKKEIITHTQKPSIFGAHTTSFVRVDEKTYNPNDAIYSSLAFKYEIINKYGLGSELYKYVDVIQMLEVKLFSAEATLKFSQELNAKYEDIIKMLNSDIKKWREINGG